MLGEGVTELRVAGLGGGGERHHHNIDTTQARAAQGAEAFADLALDAVAADGRGIDPARDTDPEARRPLRIAEVMNPKATVLQTATAFQYPLDVRTAAETTVARQSTLGDGQRGGEVRR